MTYIIRPMRAEDFTQVAEIDRESFPTQWPPFSYTSFKHELRNRLAHYIVLCKEKENKPDVAEKSSQGETPLPRFFLWLKHLFSRDHFFAEELPPSTEEYIVGSAGFWLMVDEAHLITIAVRNAYRGQDLGELLLMSVIELATQLNAHLITLEVRVSNKVAQALYEKYGFRVVGVRRGYYSDNGEDGLLMSTDTITSDSFQAHFQQLKRAHAQKQPEASLVSIQYAKR